MSDTTTEQYAADAYVKLHEDVRNLILDTVKEELQANPYGPLAMDIARICQSYAKPIMDREIQNYRIVYRGTSANS